MKRTFLLLFTALFSGAATFSQTSNTVLTKNWYLQDKDSTGINGISLDKAYDFVKAKKIKSRQVIVAVIDTGIDTLHEDLKPILWTNPNEIPYNGKDDDKNGYVDDIHGWNFLGGRDGRNVTKDSYEAARVYNKLKLKYEGITTEPSALKPEEKEEFEIFKKAKQEIIGDINPAEIAFMKKILPGFLKGDSVIAKDLGKAEYSCTDLEKYTSTDVNARKTKIFLIQLCQGSPGDIITNKQIIDEFEGQIGKADAANIAPREYRKEIVQDDETDINDRFYGNNDIMASTALHGTHCAGTIAAVRNNKKGIDGIADNVRIMMVRALADGDEHDKDVALAIRYAVDNGAQIISMSFGKYVSPEKKWVDDAVMYAEKKGVLLVHAAGNDSKNLDSADHYPTPVYKENKIVAANWITVGASGDVKNGGITAPFSNYGKKEVDVFAPGVQIYSTMPGGNNYGNLSGTSMACPVVAGTAAFILGYYPALSARQLKYVIEKSAKAPGEKVSIPGTEDKTLLSNISKTGGIINAYTAIQLANSLKGERKITSEALPVPTMKKSKKG
ncbi:MAG: S8 family serine peptidase [Ferruginibacter sp.]|nr:S8 family serine peptidase [Ferruginibacter sp.]